MRFNLHCKSAVYKYIKHCIKARYFRGWEYFERTETGRKREKKNANLFKIRRLALTYVAGAGLEPTIIPNPSLFLVSFSQFSVKQLIIFFHFP